MVDDEHWNANLRCGRLIAPPMFDVLSSEPSTAIVVDSSHPPRAGCSVLRTPLPSVSAPPTDMSFFIQDSAI